MFKGKSTLEAFEQCMKRGLCENHIKEVNKNELTFPIEEIPRKTFLFIRVNILYTILFNKSTKCERIKILLQKTPMFSRILAKGDASEAADAILILDSVVVFTLCRFSKICCIGAIFQKNNVTSEDPEVKLLQNLLLVDRFEGRILYQLFPLLVKNFEGIDKSLIKTSFVLTLLFVRSFCVKLDIKSAIKAIEEDLEISPQWENFKSMGDQLYQKGNYKDACNTYTSALMLNSYSSPLFIQRAHTYLKLGKVKAAQLDAYIAIAVDPKYCEGYYIFSSTFFHHKLYQIAFNIIKYGLAVCQPNSSCYNTLEEVYTVLEAKYINKEPPNNISENSVNPDSANKPLPEKKNFPVLVDSDSEDSESETCQKQFPELVDASDSDESENTEKKIKLTATKNKTKKKRIIPENSSNGIASEMDIDKIRTYLKEASEAVLSDCGYKAVQIFRSSLRDFIDSPKLKTFQECEIVCIKYTYGIAYYKSGEYDDLLKCITIFKEIIEKHDSVIFPAAHYALGLTYRKLNKFKEALGYLEIVQNFLCKGIHFKVHTWPELLTVIEETKPNILKVLVRDLIKECENPPNADALCRFTDCSYQPTIYYSGPDFKGYVALFCSEQCCLQYHVQCWKTIKVEKNLTDKEFLDVACFTPDCEGVFIKVQHIDKKGDIAKEFISDFKKPGKQKWAKWEKKTDVKEKKKKKANPRSEDGSLEISSENGKAISRKNSDANDKFISVQASGTMVPPSGKDTISSENIFASLQKSKSSSLVGSTNTISDICSSSVNPVKESKDTTHISETNESSSCQKEAYFYDSEEGKEISSMKTPDVTCIPEKDKGSNSMQESTFSNHFLSESEFSREVQENSSQYVSECIKENIYSYMNDFLQHHGPLKIDDPLLLDELASFPEENSSMISEFGGIGEFLKNDLRFAFVGDVYICVISDLATAYRMNSNSMQSDLGSFQSLECTENPQFFSERRLSSSLNPDAVEYTPVVLSLNGQNEEHTTENSDKNLNYRSSELKTKSSELLFTTNANSESQKDKSESCDSVMDVKFNNNIGINFKQTEVNGIHEGNENLSKKAISQSEVKSESPNLSDANCNQNVLEENENRCLDVEDFPPSHETVETIDHIDLDDDSKLKELLLVLPNLKEYCDKDFDKYHKYINDSLKPYAISKVAKSSATGTKTDFESTSENSNYNSLKAENKELEEENLSLKKQLVSANMDVKKFSDEVYELKINLSRSSFDLEALKIDFKKKEEELQNGREYLIKSLTQAHSSIDEQKKRIKVLESLKSRLEENVNELTSSVNEAEEKLKNAVKAEERKHVDIIKNLLQENEELKNRLKFAEVQFLQTKKAEYLKRIDDKFLDVSRKKIELTRGLSLLSGNLNPVVQSSMNAIFSQFSNYEEKLKMLKLEFIKNIDKQIEKVEKGTPLKELKDIEIKKIPDPPELQSSLPEFDKNPLNASAMSFNLFNMPSWPQMPSIIPTPTAASASNISPSPIVPPANPLAAVIKSGFSSAIPTAKSSASVISQATPSATIIPQSASSVKIPQTVPSVPVIPHATPSIKTFRPPSEPSSIAHSVLASVIPDIGTNPKKTYDSIDTKIKEPLRNSGVSMNAFSSIPFTTVPTLDKEFNKTCEIFTPQDSAPIKKSDTFKAPPGIANCATNLVSSRTTSNSSKDSLETFSIGSGAIGSANLARTSSFASSVNEPSMNSSDEKKKLATQKKAGSSYERLLQKLKEEFPSCSQEQLLSLVKEFRSQRQGNKLTGLPIDAIVKELRAIINARNAAEKRISEQKMQPKANKVLVNKKLVIDPKTPSTTEPPPNIKKKSAWNTVDTDCKTFAANLEDDCTICCDPMTAASAYKVACGHFFHEQCIRQWLTRKSDCPVCRVLLLLPEEYPSLT